jgi:hypothetical protein
MKKILLLMVVIILSVSGYYYYQNISKEEKEFNESGRAKAILDETDLWNYYENEEAGFSIKYPGDVSLNKDEDFLFNLSVDVKKIDSLSDTMGFNKETALKNIDLLENGEYGDNVDWPLDISKKVKRIGDVNAQDFMVLSRFEICDVTFERKVYFFYNDNQIVITLSGPKTEIMNSASEYFETNEANCGEEKIWNFDKQAQFFEELKEGNGSEVAQEWFNKFDEIIETITFNEKDNNYSVLIQGKWISLDDANSAIEFKDGKKIDFYSDEKMSEGDFSIDGKNLSVVEEGDIFEYEIIELSEKVLNLIYLSRGNILRYEKI